MPLCGKRGWLFRLSQPGPVTMGLCLPVNLRSAKEPNTHDPCTNLV